MYNEHSFKPKTPLLNVMMDVYPYVREITAMRPGTRSPCEILDLMVSLYNMNIVLSEQEEVTTAALFLPGLNYPTSTSHLPTTGARIVHFGWPNNLKSFITSGTEQWAVLARWPRVYERTFNGLSAGVHWLPEPTAPANASMFLAEGIHHQAPAKGWELIVGVPDKDAWVHMRSRLHIQELIR